MSKGTLFVLSGPSGSGKTTLCRMVEKKLGIPHSVSYTTRLPRPGEMDGKDYHFVSPQKFDSMVAQGEFLEWAHVHGNCYGTGLANTLQSIDSGQDLILDLDTQGAITVKSKVPGAVLIFVDVSDDQILATRLGQRGTEDPEVTRRCLGHPAKERKFKNEYHYDLTNDHLENTLNFILQVIEKERIT